jgi:PGF-pre-PGF domain-containing protein
LITQNEITDLNGGEVRGIALFEGDPKGKDRVGPKNFEITGNTVDELQHTGGDVDASLFIGGYEDLGTHVVSNNVLNGWIERFNGDQTGFDYGDATPLNLKNNDVTTSYGPALIIGKVGEVSGNTFSVAGSARKDEFGRPAVGAYLTPLDAGEDPNSRLDSLVASNEITTIRPAIVTDVTLSNPSGKELKVTVSASGEPDKMTVDLDAATDGTLRIEDKDFSEPSTNDGTYTYTNDKEVTAKVPNTYQATVKRVNGNDYTLNSGTVLFVSGGTKDVEVKNEKSESVEKTNVEFSENTEAGASMVVESREDLPDTGKKDTKNLEEDIDEVEESDDIVAAVDVEPKGNTEDGDELKETDATVEFEIQKNEFDVDPSNLLVAKYDDGAGEYVSLPTDVVEITDTTVIVEGDASDFSLFTVVAREDVSRPSPEPTELVLTANRSSTRVGQPVAFTVHEGGPRGPTVSDVPVKLPDGFVQTNASGTVVERFDEPGDVIVKTTDSLDGFSPDSTRFSVEESLAAADVTVTDRTVTSGTETLTVDSAARALADGTPGEYVVAVHVLRDDGTLSDPVGYSAVQTGSADNVTVDLNASEARGDALDALTENVTLRAMLHEPADTGVLGSALTVDGSTPTDTARIEIAGSAPGAGSPLSGVPGRYDDDADGAITVVELGDAAAAYTQGELTIEELGDVAAVYAQS